jgi:hypothetical protein
MELAERVNEFPKFCVSRIGYGIAVFRFRHVKDGSGFYLRGSSRMASIF